MTTLVTSESTTEAVREAHPYFSEAIARVLMKTPAAKWSAYAVLLDAEAEAARLMLKGDLIAWLRSNDLAGLAREAASRRVRQGGILVLVLGREGPRFRVLFELDRPVRRKPR